MASIDRPPAEGNLGPFALRPAATTDRPPPHPAGPGHLRYRFDAPPDWIHDEIKAGWLKPIDLPIFIEMMRWGRKRGRRDSCWTTKGTIAVAIGCDPRTVQSSWARLRRRGLTDPRPFADGIDPDDPANHTGWRIYFPWADGSPPRPLDPSEPAPARRKRGRPRKSADPGEKFISPPPLDHPGPPPPETSVSPPPGKSASPNEEERILKPDGITLDGVACASGGGETPPMDVEPVAAREIPAAAAPPADDAQTAEWLRHLRNPRSPLRRFAYWGLEEAGLLPAEFAGAYPPRRPDSPRPVGRALEDVLEKLKAAPAEPPPPPATTPKIWGSSPAAPKVPRVAQADVKARLGRLTQPETTNADVLATSRALAAALGPHDEPEATDRQFFMWCGQARSGLASLSQGILIDAFEGACEHKSARKRGAVFVHLVKQSAAKKKAGGVPRPSISP